MYGQVGTIGTSGVQDDKIRRQAQGSARKPSLTQGITGRLGFVIIVYSVSTVNILQGQKEISRTVRHQDQGQQSILVENRRPTHEISHTLAIM